MVSRLDDLYSRIGKIESDVKWIKERAVEDRDTQDERHKENKGALDKLASELRRQSSTVQMSGPQMEQTSRARLALLASIGLVTLWVVGRALEAGVGWLVEKLLHMKFGG